MSMLARDVARRQRRQRSALAATLALLALLLAAVPAAAQEGQNPAPPAPPFDVPVRAAVLMDVHSGKVLYAKNPEEAIAPASLAKIMTMFVALDAIKAGQARPEDRFQVDEEVWRLSLAGGRGAVSTMYLDLGSEVSLGDLLFGVGVLSGNDASLAVAKMLAGSEQVFVELMNRRAAELGLTATRFRDSHGLDPEATTTALDMARLGRAFVRLHRDGLTYASAREFTWNGIRQQNRNRLLSRDERVTGLKTGHLSVAGFHLVATAEDGDMSLVAAVLGACHPADGPPCSQAEGFRRREQAALDLLNYGFSRFITLRPAWGENGSKTVPLYKGAKAQVRVAPRELLVVTVNRDDQSRVQVVEELPRALVAPLKAGEQVGTVRVLVGDREELAVPLVAAEDAPRGGFFKVLWDSVRLLLARLTGRS